MPTLRGVTNTPQEANQRAARTHAPRPDPFWPVVLAAMLVPCLGSLVYFVWLGDSGVVRLLYAGTKLFTLIWPVAALGLILGEPLPRPTLSRSDLRRIGPGALSGLAIVLAMGALLQSPLGEVIGRGAPAIREKATRFGILDNYWVFALLLSTVHSLLEEYYWRWFVYGQLRRRLRPLLAHGAAGLAFASHHVVIAGVYFGWGWGFVLGAGVGLGGVLWSLLYERQRTLLGAWISHLVVDLGLMAVGHHLLFGSWLGP